MKSNQFNKYIKDQVDLKEVEPSHDAWDRIQARMIQGEEEKPSSKKWWLSAAALALVVSFSGYLILDSAKETGVETVKTEEQPSMPTDSVEVERQVLMNKQVEVVQENKPSSAQAHKEKAAKELETSPVKAPGHVVPKLDVAISQPLSQKELRTALATSLDTVQVAPKKKKKNYVDSEDLLYSIENKDNIKKTKEGGRVAVIDLNKKED